MSKDDFNAGALDEIIHGKLRLAIMAYLSAVSEASFTELKQKTEASDGNLSVHMRKLEEAGYIAVDKSFVDRRPRTTLTLTPAGRKAWIAYLDELRNLTGR
ncbi:transcriptional regulator [Hyphobacterium sp. HN65]|uniref:Transcriptional regulator n=1 Tax=Hyphobacterium lacteum TaxID=3116575 RepID=A0ABU7LTD0_9PROT|nr:transcriptional regulator [Hyphobacterium sp. HN65]MEE2526906.1 transcriptional regulator [Hyphobacterium sp. HN65]